MRDYPILLDAIKACPWNITEVVSGGAPGADRLGEIFANDHCLPLKVFKAPWVTHGKAAGIIRNGWMADYGEALIALWDGQSPGTKNMIAQAKRKGLVTLIWAV